MINLKKIAEIAAVRGNAPCLIAEDKAYTWNEVLSLTESRVAFIKNFIEPEKMRSACFLSKNNGDLICWLAAFTTLGIPTNGLDYSLPITTLLNLVKKINPGILLVSYSLYTTDELNQLYSTGASVISVNSPTDAMVDSIGSLHRKHVAEILEQHRPVPFRAVSLTSGTSSEPKIALRYQSFDARRFSWFTERYGFTHRDGFMLILPLYHAAGNGWARMFMGLGAPLYLVDQNDDVAIGTLISRDDITATVMTPNLVSRVTKLVEQQHITTHFRWILVGGSNFAPHNKMAAMSALGPVIHEYYGCTESGVNILAEPDDIIRHPDSVGRAFDGNKVVILDENNRLVPAGTKGRVAIASYMLMDEYGDGRKPFVTLGDDVYFPMADYGYLDNHGRLFLMNRNGDRYDKNHVYGVEETLRSLPCIHDVAIISVANESENMIKLLFSTFNNRPVNDDVLNEKIKEKLQQHNIVKFKAKKIDEIPYSPSGKVRFQEVVNLLEAA